MKHIQNKKVLIIADVHQCLGYVDRVLKVETDWDHVVFLGDFFDCFEEPDNINYFTVKNVCAWLNMKFEEWGDRVTWLLGNHDCTYLATYKPNSIPTKNNFYYCSGYSRSKAGDFNHTIDKSWVDSLELCCRVGEYYLSHAGFQYEHFKPFISVEENIKMLYDEWERDKHAFGMNPYHWIYYAGRSRGGEYGKGSPIWLNWDDEFIPLPEIKQIVGHSNSNRREVRERDGNYCIDNYRQLYGIIHPDGKFEPKWI